MSTSEIDGISPDAESESDDTPVFVPRYRHRWTWVETGLSSLFGLIASIVLSMDALAIAANPGVVFSCDISAKISCGAVGRSWQATLLGDLPNAYLGMIAEPVIITVAAASLAGVVFARWFMLAAHVVSGLGFIFAWWLFYQAATQIHILCPWCLAITVTTTLIFVAFTRINILDGRFGKRIQQRVSPLIRLYHVDWIFNVLVIALLSSYVILNYL